MWKHSCPEVQHETLRIDQKIGGLKNVDIFLKNCSVRGLNGYKANHFMNRK